MAGRFYDEWQVGDRLTHDIRRTVTETDNISPYLTPGPDAFVTKRQTPLSPVPETRCGNKPSDGGNLLLTDEEKAALEYHLVLKSSAPALDADHDKGLVPKSLLLHLLNPSFVSH